ncbi:NAD-dependent epimerase/dehydratase family protein [Angustibacter speluncae]
MTHRRPTVVTGAAGAVARTLVPELAGPVRLVDLPGADLPGTEQAVEADLTDAGQARAALAGAVAVVHLAGQASPAAAWPDLVRSNLVATANVLDAAAEQGVRHVVLASSVHADGDAPASDWPVDPARPPQPCCRYGVSKVAVEQLGRDHAREHPGTAVVCLRLGLVADRPRWRDEALGWTPTDVLGPWVRAALDARAGHHVVFALAEVTGRARYVTDPTTALLGSARPVRPDDLDGLPSAKVELAPGCRLWRSDAT